MKTTMKFPRDKSFDEKFAQVEGARWYPYVGIEFGKKNRRIMVYAHNIPIKPEVFEERQNNWKDAECWANAIDEYTYAQKDYTEAFRFFIKAASGLSENYTVASPPEVLNRVDSFVREIAYLNYIQDLVLSESQLTDATGDQIEISNRVNREYLEILGITHCVTWGKSTYSYIQAMDGVHVRDEKSEGKKGFESCILERERGTPMHLLRVYHPSMPSFNPYSPDTQRIISEFLKR